MSADFRTLICWCVVIIHSFPWPRRNVLTGRQASTSWVTSWLHVPLLELFELKTKHWGVEKFEVVFCKPVQCNNIVSITGFVMTFLSAGESIYENSAFPAVQWVYDYLSSSHWGSCPPYIIISPLIIQCCHYGKLATVSDYLDAPPPSGNGWGWQIDQIVPRPGWVSSKMGYTLCPTLQRDGNGSISVYIFCHTEKQKWPPWGHLFWALCFSPRPCALGGWAPGSQSLSCSYFCATQTAQLYQSKDDGQRECSVSLKDKESVVRCWVSVNWDSLLVIWCASFFFSPPFSPFVVSIDSASSSTWLESSSIMCKFRGTPVGNATQLALVNAPSHLMSGLNTWYKHAPPPRYLSKVGRWE